jgi:hypothetical protein
MQGIRVKKKKSKFKCVNSVIIPMQGMRKNFNIIFKLYTEIYENTSTNAM